MYTMKCLTRVQYENSLIIEDGSRSSSLCGTSVHPQLFWNLGTFSFLSIATFQLRDKLPPWLLNFSDLAWTGTNQTLFWFYRYNRTAAQVMIRWSVQRGFITIPKSVHEDRIIENSQVFDWSIEEGYFNNMVNFHL